MTSPTDPVEQADAQLRYYRCANAPACLAQILVGKWCRACETARQAAFNEAAGIARKHIDTSGRGRPHGDGCFEDVARAIEALAESEG